MDEAPYPHGLERDVDDGVAPASAAEPDGLSRPEAVLLLAASGSSILRRTVTVDQIDTHLKSSDLPNHLGRQQNFLRNRKKGFGLTEKGLSSALPSSKGLGS